MTALAARGDLRDAVAACHSEFSDDTSWDLRLTDVINEMTVGQLHECIDLILDAAQKRGAYHRRSIFCTVVKKLSGSEWAGDLDQIRRATEAEPCSFQRDLISALALAYARSYMPESARQLLPHLEKASQDEVLDSDRLRTRSALCLALALVGEDDRASEILMKLGEDIRQAQPHRYVLTEVLRNTALVAVRTNLLDKWLTVLDTITGEGIESVLATSSRRDAIDGLIEALSLIPVEQVESTWLKATLNGFKNNLSLELFERCVEHEKFDLAHAVVRGMFQTSRSIYLEKLLGAYTKKRAWWPALATIESMDNYRRAKPLAALALDVSEEPDGSLLDKIERLGDSLGDGRIVALSGVARAVLRRGDPDSAKQRIYALLMDLDKASSDPSPWKRCRTALLRELAGPSRFQQALLRIDNLEDSWYRDRLREEISSHLLEAGLAEEAIQVSAGIAETNRTQAIREIALAFVGQGGDARALQLIAASGIWKFGQGSIRADMIDALLNAGELDRATAVFEGAPEDAYQTVPPYAAGLSRLGLSHRALTVAREARTDTRGRALMAVAEDMHSKGDSRAGEIAREALAELEDRTDSDSVDRIRLQILSGQIDEAILSAKFVDGYTAREKMSSVVSLLVDFGEFDQAMSLIEAIGETYAKAALRETLLTSLVKRGEVDRALSYADGLARFDRATARKYIVRALAGAHQSINEAVRIASEITEASYRAESLADCAVSLLANGSVRRVMDVLDMLDEVKEVVYRARAIEAILQRGGVDSAILQRLVTMSRALDTEYYRAETFGAAAGAWVRLGNVAEGLKMLDEGLDAANQSEWRETGAVQSS